MKPSSKIWLTAWLKGLAAIAFIALTLTLVSGSALAEVGATNACPKTSVDMLQSCRDATQSALALAVAKCDNISDPAARKACMEQAMADRKDASDLCKAQFAARQEICRALGKGPYDPVINPADFTNSTTINNPFFPLVPGAIYIYEGTTEKGFEHVVVTVTSNTKVIMGVTCVEVRDTVTVDGLLEEDTLDWFAQDNLGNVWYFGENTLSYEGGLIVSLKGSFTAGVDGAKPGIIMEASPKIGDIYRQEFDLGNAEDLAQVLSLTDAVTVPAGAFTNCLRTKEFSPLEPDALEHKFYAAGVGNLRTTDVATGNHTDLIQIIPPGP